jgi:diacylglycerol kinase family enzyme
VRLLIVNPRSGDDSPSPDELADAARARGVTVHVLGDGEDPGAAARAAADADVLGVAGGDGSLGSVVAVALERDVPFVCIPFGTRNHFARDVGLDVDDPLGSLAAFDGEERRIDVGSAGERVFLNNVSIGAYAKLVAEQKHGKRLRAWLLALRHGLSLAVDDEPLHDVRVLLVSNNDYQRDPVQLGVRERLDEGRLYLYLMCGRLPRTRRTARSGERFRIDGPRRIEAAIDGEALELELPLELAVRPRALRLLVPASRPQE